MGDSKPTGVTMFGSESISPSQSRTSNISGSIPQSVILKNTALLRRSDFHLSPDNPFLQVDSRPPPGTVFTSEDLCTGSQVDSCPPPGTVFTSDDLCTGRKRRRGYNKDKENPPPQSIRNNLAAIVIEKNLEPQHKVPSQTPYNVKNSVSGSYSDSNSIPPSTGVFSSSDSTPPSNTLKNTALLRRTYVHLSPDDPFLKLGSRPPETVFTCEDLCTGRGANKDKENTPSKSIRYIKAMNGRSLTKKPRPPRVNGLVSVQSTQLPTRIPLSNMSNIDVSRGLPEKRGKLKKKNFLAEITRTLFEETEESNGEDRNYESLDQSWIAKFDSNYNPSSSVGRGTRVSVKPEYWITPPAKEFANDYTLSSEMGFSANSVAEALLMHDNYPDKV
ncbi:uncharacterized protein LOC108227715 [Daucus carota subsp. sativus]|uniref:uncharacterized protein LOC108227715 n=1 Tax=Daucus carota subsp. sativus TaxID=79200 RepID=UPI0007EF8DA3|nr:PREDICTED: uncharacterized protein LOC108227715 isoform X3 [Daucus carota subsp. sativus]